MSEYKRAAHNAASIPCRTARKAIAPIKDRQDRDRLREMKAPAEFNWSKEEVGIHALR